MLLRPVTLFGEESAVQSMNAKGGTNQRRRPISGQMSHRSEVTSFLVRKGYATRTTIHLLTQHRTRCSDKTAENSIYSLNNDVIKDISGHQEASVKNRSSAAEF